MKTDDYRLLKDKFEDLQENYVMDKKKLKNEIDLLSKNLLIV